MGDYLLNTALSLNPIETLQLGIYYKMHIMYVLFIGLTFVPVCARSGPFVWMWH